MTASIASSPTSPTISKKNTYLRPNRQAENYRMYSPCLTKAEAIRNTFIHDRAFFRAVSATPAVIVDLAAQTNGTFPGGERWICAIHTEGEALIPLDQLKIGKFNVVIDEDFKGIRTPTH
ncbi:MAG: hypothetical protein VW268_14085 [Rhodospirillaceae bacterium]